MKITLGAALALATLFLAACGGKATPPPPLPAPPSIKTFTANKTRLQLGESVTMSFTAENAQSVELVDHRGAVIELSGDASSGEAVATPGESSFYVLRARGEGGRDTAFLQVAVGEDLQEVFLVAVPPLVDSGESVQLLWSAPHAREAKIQSSAGQELPLPAASGTGVLEVIPARTVAYTLVASGADASRTLTASAQVKVRPVLSSFTATPSAARVGEVIRFDWKTRGASEVSLAEATFGALHQVSAPGQVQQVDEGSFEWTVPDTLPSGGAMQEGQPLRFTLTVRTINPEVSLTQVAQSYVGDGPLILDFRAPLAVTEGNTVQLSWRTFNATRLQVLVGGGVIHEPLAKDQAAIAQGSVILPAPTTEATYQLRVWSHLGGTATASRLVGVVKAPFVSTFTLPETVNQAGEVAAANWTTLNATAVAVRVKNGPVLFRTEQPATVAAGSTGLYPGLKTTFVLEAYNAAGDVATAERTVEVAIPGALTASPSPALAGSTVTVEWALDPGLTAQLVGVPGQQPLKNNPGQSFYDLEIHSGAKALAFADPDNAVAEVLLDAPFFFPLAGTLNSRFFVSTNGFVAFANAGPMPQNIRLDSAAGSIPTVLAPFWDDLSLGSTGRVLYFVDGQSFPRRLVIQWDKVRTAVDEQSVLTFQVQLAETGEVQFGYKRLEGTDAYGDNASVGFRLNHSLAAELSHLGGALLAEGDELVWFGSGELDGQLQFVPERAGVFTLFGRRPAGGYVVYPGRMNLIAAGSVLLNEAMILPDASASEGRWVELYNSSDAEVDLGGTQLASTSNGTSWTLTEGLSIPPGGYLLVGESADPNLNGNVPVEFTWSGFFPETAGNDTLVLSAGGPISSLDYELSKLVAGVSVQAPEAAINSAGVGVTCTRTQTFNAAGAIGTPGSVNETCFDYSVQPIPVSYRDISITGTPLFSGTSLDEQRTSFVLDQPFTYFGSPYSELHVSTNGFVTFVNLTTAGLTNKILPSTVQPTGTIAPFWDDLNGTITAGANVFAQRFEPGTDPASPGGHWVVQWHQFLHYGTNPADDLNLQVKLFDNGNIEFHYAAMTSGTSLNYANGNSATIWLEHPNGGSALAVGRNQPVIAAHTAYRFTPKAN